MSELIIRMYNVRFGDGILITIPDEDENGQAKTRHILIDVGNVKSGEGGQNEVFEPVIEDILNVLNGQPLDLYIMTHEHLDHVQGLLWYAKNVLGEAQLRESLNVQHSWLPISAHPNYYDDFTEAKKKFDLAAEAFRQIKQFKEANGTDAMPQLDILLKNNNRFLSANAANLSHGRTADCVEYLRQLASENTHYIYRNTGSSQTDLNPLYTFDPETIHPFRRAKFEIWAPEEDSSDYYGRFKPMALNLSEGGNGAPALTTTVPPQGVDASAFYNLMEHRQSSIYDNLLAIDKAANNSSIVFCLEWAGWRFLFPGDAEERSWKEMNKEKALTPIDFLKISHHGSHNGTPEEEILEKVLPPPTNGVVDRHAAVSTFRETYNGIPHDETLDELVDLGCTIHSTLDTPVGQSLVIQFPARE